MELASKRLVWLRNGGVAATVAAIVAGILLPLYTDEVGWRLQERAGFDGTDKLLTELCGPNTIARPPFWMLPARYYSAFFNGSFPDPLFVRLSGVLYALIWIAMLLILIRRIAGPPRDQIVLTVIAMGLVCLGTMPLILIWSRPEQPILLACTSAILIASSDWQQVAPATPVKAAWLRSMTILALALMAMSYHLKALFLIPLFLSCIFFASRGHRAHLPRAIAAVLLAVAAAWAAQYWIARLACPNDAAMHANFVSNNTGAALVGASGWSQISPLIGKALSNISLFQYLGMPAPREQPMSFWLEPHKIGLQQSFTWFVVLVVIWMVTVLLAGFGVAGAAGQAWRERRLAPRPIIVALLVAAVLGWSATQGFRNIYEANFVVPVMVLAVIMALSTDYASAKLARMSGVLAVVLGLMGIANIVLVAAIYGPSLVQASRERGYLERQPHSISAFGYPGLRREILAAARKCGIAPRDTGHALLLDDVTYFAFMQSHMPEHYYGLFSPEITIKDPLAYLRGVKSDGAVVSCRVLPADLQSHAKREGRFCCLAPPW